MYEVIYSAQKCTVIELGACDRQSAGTDRSSAIPPRWGIIIGLNKSVSVIVHRVAAGRGESI